MWKVMACVIAVAVLFPGQAFAETWIALKRAAFEGHAGRWDVIEGYEPFASETECLQVARATVRWFGSDEGLDAYVRSRAAWYSADGLKVTLDIEVVVAHQWRVYALEMRCWPLGAEPSTSPALPPDEDPARWARRPTPAGTGAVGWAARGQRPCRDTHGCGRGLREWVRVG